MTIAMMALRGSLGRARARESFRKQVYSVACYPLVLQTNIAISSKVDGQVILPPCRRLEGVFAVGIQAVRKEGDRERCYTKSWPYDEHKL